MPANSILDDVKASLALSADYTPFDAEIILHLNAVLSDLHQLGIGPADGLQVTDNTTTWTDLLNDDLRLNNVKSYVHLRVKMLFDPPTIGYVVTATEHLIEKAEWRITVAKDEIDRPPVVVPVVDPYDPFGDPITP